MYFSAVYCFRINKNINDPLANLYLVLIFLLRCTMKNMNKMSYFSLVAVTLGLGIGLSQTAYAAGYGQKLCQSNDNYTCYKVQKGETWASLFSDAQEEDTVRRINRMNVELSRGMIIAIPKDSSMSVMEASPFPQQIEPSPTSRIIFDKSDLAWGAYDPNGNLVKWGPAAGGKDYCADVGRSCKTVTGTFTVYSKRGEGCSSSKYPIGKGGAPMPYCMFFHGGYALHGSPTVPGYHASHGCVRLFNEDAEWLNEQFVDVGRTKVTVRY